METHNYYPEEFFKVHYPEESFNVIDIDISAEHIEPKQVITRFPPEPNGYLHLGHVKAMELDFGFAEYMMGQCIMRFDDTNPTAEKEEYIHQILEDVKWMGYNYSKITYTSDYFDLLYEFAVKLINDGDAYVCELKSEEISLYREQKKESPYKNRSIKDNLILFEEMKNGNAKYVLRMKGDLSNPNPCLWDTIMYRVLNISHNRTGDKWKMYPTYDFSHCIVDSIEGITHSFCTKEFEIRRELYYWFLDKLKLRKPYEYEFARLNISSGTLSKRKIKQLVDESIVSSWSDPRLLTISGLRNKGYTNTSLRKFCYNLGITKSDSEISIDMLNCILRDELNYVKRKLVVIEPLKLNIINFSDIPEDIKICKLLDYPYDKASSYRIVNLTQIVYIEKASYKTIDDKNFYGLAPNKIIRLKYGPFVKYVKENIDGSIDVEYVDPEKNNFNFKKIKGILNWTNANFVTVKINMFIQDYKIKTYESYAEEHIIDDEILQFERIGYYKRSEDFTFNEIVSLKSSY